MVGLLETLESPIAMVALSLLAYFDAIVGINMAVPGEIAFLVAGASLSANGSVVPVVLVLSAALLGDMTSYYLGRRYGPRLLRRYLKRSKRRKLWRKAQATLLARGAGFVVVARLLGPISWVTPFLAGTVGTKPQVFAPAAALGVMIGAGLFVLYGAVGLKLFDVFWAFICDHHVAIALEFTMLSASEVVWRRSNAAAWKKTLKAVAVSSGIFLATNFSYFFVLDTHAAAAAQQHQGIDQCHAASDSFQVSSGDTPLHLPQPINVILFSEGNGAELMQALGWHRNMSFTHDEVGFVTYLKSLIQKTPPVSELYLHGAPADGAFQMPGTLKTREHIRWWQQGTWVHFGAISRDDAIAVKYYAHLPVILHDIDPDVDASRRLLAVVSQSPRRQVSEPARRFLCCCSAQKSA